MSHLDHEDIRIGTLAGFANAHTYLPQIVGHGFESFQLTNWQYLPEIDLEAHAKAVLAAIEGKAIISSLGVYGNPLQDEKCAEHWKKAIKLTKSFGCSIVCGFAGALEDRPVDESIPKFKEVFGEIAKVAEGEGVRIGFENCDMGGTWDRPKWNIAHSPRAWEMMFDAVPGDTLGLEWEPCHQMVSFVEPIGNLRQWASKVVHVHGKCATIHHDLVRQWGSRSGHHVVSHRTPGFGDCNWHDIITILRQAGFRGAIDIEGWHDPVYREDLEMTGQVYGLNYLKACRGGPYIANPV